MSRSSLSSALFFSPAIYDYEIEWDGYTAAEIVIYDTLKAERTYAVTVTNSLQDIRNNKLAKSYTFAFSTGAVVDSGAISGQVFDALSQPAKGALVMAYLLPEPNSGVADTLDPSKVLPDYIAQTDVYGKFLLSYLAEGRYRILAITDENKNMLYDIGTESFAVPTVSLIKTGMKDLKLRFTTEDTTAIELQSATPITSQQIAVKFNRTLLHEEASSKNFSLFDSTALKPIRVYDFSVEYESNAQYFYLSIDSLIEDNYYELRASGLRDAFGNELTAQQVPFFGVQEPDTLKAVFQIPFVDSTSGLLYSSRPDARGKTLSLSFTRPIQRKSLDQAISLYKQDDQGNYSWVESRIFFEDAKRFELKPTEGFELGAWYKLVLEHAKVQDALERPTLDTTYQLRFQIADLSLFGGIEGKVYANQLGNIIVSAWQIGKKTPYRTLVKNIDRVAEFEFPALPEGKYRLTAFQPNADLSNVTAYTEWHGGHAFPAKPAENFTVGQDTLRVRKRWTTSDLILNLD